ncbi:hypothetical protein [Streptomyces sp. NPDC004296]|uniref:hypothetical protein n=1 Tax=Streptomyces sp. NPDC004296 TaxID=3364697 RepID=UPI0036C536A8
MRSRGRPFPPPLRVALGSPCPHSELIHTKRARNVSRHRDAPAPPLLGGLAIDAGLGFPSVAWVGAATGLLGLAATAWAAALQRRGRPAAPPVTVPPRIPASAAATKDG